MPQLNFNFYLQFRCVPYYGCKDGVLVTNGKDLVDIRSLDPSNSKCPGDLEVCCQHPDWEGISIDEIIEIKKPGMECKTLEEKLLNQEKSQCNHNGVIYQDLDPVPSNDDCNSCFCDFGVVVCTEELCDSSGGNRDNLGIDNRNKVDLKDTKNMKKMNELRNKTIIDNAKWRAGSFYYPKCGQRNKNGIGVGIKYQNTESSAHSSQFGEWPHMCAVLNKTSDGNEDFISGASLIDSSVVLTVAHYLE